MQYTVAGQTGVNGLHAVSPVEPVPKNVLEPVPVPLHVMAGDHAQEQRGKRKHATSRRALVRSEKCIVTSSNACTALGIFLITMRGILFLFLFFFLSSQSEKL